MRLHAWFRKGSSQVRNHTYLEDEISSRKVTGKEARCRRARTVRLEGGDRLLVDRMTQIRAWHPSSIVDPLFVHVTAALSSHACFRVVVCLSHSTKQRLAARISRTQTEAIAHANHMLQMPPRHDIDETAVRSADEMDGLYAALVVIHVDGFRSFRITHSCRQLEGAFGRRRSARRRSRRKEPP